MPEDVPHQQLREVGDARDVAACGADCLVTLGVQPRDLAEDVRLRERLPDDGIGVLPELACERDVCRGRRRTRFVGRTARHHARSAHEVAGTLVEVAGHRARSCTDEDLAAATAAPMPDRSWNNVVLATVQPLFTAPMHASSRTTASVKKTSLNIVLPVISRSGRTSTPGWCMSNANQLMP